MNTITGCGPLLCGAQTLSDRQSSSPTTTGPASLSSCAQIGPNASASSVSDQHAGSVGDPFVERLRRRTRVDAGALVRQSATARRVTRGCPRTVFADRSRRANVTTARRGHCEHEDGAHRLHARDPVQSRHRGRTPAVRGHHRCTVPRALANRQWPGRGPDGPSTGHPARASATSAGPTIHDLRHLAAIRAGTARALVRERDGIPRARDRRRNCT